MNSISAIQGYVSLLNEFCNKQMFIEDGTTNYCEKLIANQLIYSYEAICDLRLGEQLIHQYSSSTITHVPTLSYDLISTDTPNTHLLAALKATDIARNYKNGSFYLYGSVASGDSIAGWSDIDSMLLIDENVVNSAPDLLELRNLMLTLNYNLKTLDPLQHHGVFVLPRHFLDFYLDSFLPISNLGPILSQFSDTINYRTINTGNSLNKLLGLLDSLERYYHDGIMKHHPFKGEYLLGEFRNSDNSMYQLKYYLGLFTILPSFFASHLNHDSYKPTAIDFIANKLDQSSNDWLDRISRLRLNWNAKANSDYIIHNRVPPQVYEYIPSNYFELGAMFARRIREMLFT